MKHLALMISITLFSGLANAKQYVCHYTEEKGTVFVDADFEKGIVNRIETKLWNGFEYNVKRGNLQVRNFKTSALIDEENKDLFAMAAKGMALYYDDKKDYGFFVYDVRSKYNKRERPVNCLVMEPR